MNQFAGWRIIHAIRVEMKSAALAYAFETAQEGISVRYYSEEIAAA